MQFRLHINDTNDGTVIAKELRRLAQMIDGSPLNHGLRRDLHKGYASMEIQPIEYKDCATAEKELGFTLDWQQTDTEYKGRIYGHVHAIVKKDTGK
jgi:hypothetical protein